jgi:hypothetical protein
LREQTHHAAQRNEACAHLADGSAIVLAEVGNRLVIGYKPARQPHHLNVAPSFMLEPPARLNPIEITDGLTGIIIGQFNQEHSAFCFPQRLEDQMRAIENDRRGHSGRPSEKSLSAIANFEAEMRAAVARYMREHPERLSERTLEVIIEALLYAFPCPG